MFTALQSFKLCDSQSIYIEGYRHRMASSSSIWSLWDWAQKLQEKAIIHPYPEEFLYFPEL